jgi:ribosomal protein L39E
MSKEQTSKTKLRFVKEIRHNRKIIPKGIFKKV